MIKRMRQEALSIKSVRSVSAYAMPWQLHAFREMQAMQGRNRVCCQGGQRYELSRSFFYDPVNKNGSRLATLAARRQSEIE